jgi:hypothetical protein
MLVRFLIATALASLGGLSLMADVIELVNIDTAPIQGQTGYLAFDFLGGAPVESNTIVISSFTSNASLGTLVLTGGASGTLVPGPATLNDSQFFNELLQAVTFGSTTSFSLDLTTSVSPGGIPDAFAFYLLDSTQNPYTTSDPTGANSLFDINVDGSSLTPRVYTSPSASSTVTPAATTVPEPNSVVLLAAAIVSLALLGRRREARLSRGYNVHNNGGH